MVQGRDHAMRAILALALLCSAFSGEAQAEPSADTVARGKALAEAADCASCHTTDPSKPFAVGKRIDTPLGAIYSPNLTPDRLGIASISQIYKHNVFDVVSVESAPDGTMYFNDFSAIYKLVEA